MAHVEALPLSLVFGCTRVVFFWLFWLFGFFFCCFFSLAHIVFESLAESLDDPEWSAHIKHRVSAEMVLEQNFCCPFFFVCVRLLMSRAVDWEVSLKMMGRIDSMCSCASGKVDSCKLKASLPTFMPCFGLPFLFRSCWFQCSAAQSVRCRCLKHALSQGKADKGWDISSAKVRKWVLRECLKSRVEEWTSCAALIKVREGEHWAAPAVGCRVC